MAIPFYEPRQQAASECDQVDGHFPPAPSSPAIPLPTANFQSAANANQTPPVARSCTTTANMSTATVSLSASTATRTPSTVSRTSTITTAQVTNSSITANTSGSSTHVSADPSNSTTAFTIPSDNHPISAASFSPNSANTETTQTTFSTAASSTSPEPLPWKLLAVSMCKALKQYYEQTNSPDVFTTAIIEILPTGSPTQSSAAGN
ncbi:putative protein TPRXL [Ceratitis capitata]|uniref:(Mediterranean fruit fly) hypothetical protein n=1 Tax=Ceratitis capitata TaxID=7213 RepID=A0A811V7H8_CERCA|nr:putative protein TPRXL [Ceratitis capitata]CAD7005766.1 unnamed protein product [Ceratitis capitata]